MRRRLEITWVGISYPQQAADALSYLLSEMEPDFREIGFDTKLPEHKRRLWNKVPEHSLLSRSMVFDIPSWQIGYDIDQNSYDDSIYPKDIILPERGQVKLFFYPPDYTQTLSVNQSPLEYLRFGDPRTFKSRDAERDEKCLKLLYEAVYRLGLHPEGPNSPVSWEWGFDY